MNTPLRILLVEDSEDDAELILREIRKGGYEPDWQRVDTVADLETALERASWDVVITDHNLPGYGSETTISTVKNSGLDIPIIIVSGSIGESIAVEAMKNGAHDYIMKDNLVRLVPAITRELHETKNRYANRRAQETIRHLAYHDSLTGLANRHSFENEVQSALRSIDAITRHAMLYLDLDQFKVINDTCGHEAGDELLRQLAIILEGPLRATDTLARLGGDEFGILLTHCDLDQAVQVAERVLNFIKEFRYVWKDKTFSIGASIGLVMLEDRAQTLSEVMRIADMACYAAKDHGRNRMHVYSVEDTEFQQRRGEMEWVARISKALESDLFTLFRQCIEPLGRNTDRHCEILIRMLDDDGEPVLPGVFIPAAERYNIMPAIDRWVVQNVFAFLEQNGAGANSEIYFINLSGATLSDDHFAAFVTDQLKTRKLSPTRIGFEITETAVIANLNSAINFINRVKKLGCRIALDDFGAGLSSFSYLKTIRADYLKIDGGFIKDMLDDPMDHAIVVAINDIGHVVGLKTIAEFVESASIKQRLNELGVDYAQGFAINHPTPLTTFS